MPDKAKPLSDEELAEIRTSMCWFAGQIKDIRYSRFRSIVAIAQGLLSTIDARDAEIKRMREEYAKLTKSMTTDASTQTRAADAEEVQNAHPH